MNIWTMKRKPQFDCMQEIHAFHKDLSFTTANMPEKQLLCTKFKF